jgi:hypothetical protein
MRLWTKLLACFGEPTPKLSFPMLKPEPFLRP